MTAVIKDGFSTTISFADDPTISVEEKGVTPPGIVAGGEIDATTMRNTAYRTKFPKQLKSLSDAGANVAYHPETLVEFLAMVGSNQEITITFSDASTYVFWGWIDEFTPGEIVEGQQPMAVIKIICSNLNASEAEIAPVYTP
jgi:hypothetical protein